MNLLTNNPCDRIGPALGPQGDLLRHMRALPHGEVAGAIERVRASRAWAGAKLAFEFLLLTAARSGEVRGARWDEMDTEDHVWTVPATRMKMKREHRVPLCGRALDILGAARTLDGGDGVLVFRSISGTEIFRGETVANGSENTISVFSVDAATGEPTLVQTIDTRSIAVRNMAFQPDGRSMVASSPEPGQVRTGGRLETVPAPLTLYDIEVDGRLAFKSHSADRHARGVDVLERDRPLLRRRPGTATPPRTVPGPRRHPTGGSPAPVVRCPTVGGRVRRVV